MHVFIIHLHLLAPILKTVFTTPTFENGEGKLPKLGNKHISKQAILYIVNHIKLPDCCIAFTVRSIDAIVVLPISKNKNHVKIYKLVYLLAKKIMDIFLTINLWLAKFGNVFASPSRESNSLCYFFPTKKKKHCPHVQIMDIFGFLLTLRKLQDQHYL